MRQETLQIPPNRSKRTNLGQLIISAPSVLWDSVDLVVGRIGFPNVQQTLHVGGVVFYETPDDGLIELRVTQFQTGIVGDLAGNQVVQEATVLVSQVSPRGGLTAAFTQEDISNTPFEAQEIHRLRESLREVREAVRQREDVTPEQADFVSRKLDEMARAAERLGRKDWMNHAIGTLTSVVVTAAINSEAARFLFQALGKTLSWLFGETLKLLP